MITIREYNTAVKEYSRNIYRYVCKSIRDEEGTEDIVQDCYIKLWEHRENVNPDKVKYWLFATAHNTMLKYIQQASKTISFDKANFIEPFVRENQNFELKEQIDKALELLPQIQKTIILLRDLEGYNYEEIGEILDLNESQVKVYLFRARQKMQKSLMEFNKAL
jgi:RNA polymerase sigma factor (sigma-70 family)